MQLHCPPTAVIEDAATYDALDALVADGAIAAYGVSVETCAQALAAIARPNVTNVQIIFNPFRLKPLDEVLPAAEAAGVAIFARVPLASGLLSGKYTAATTFAANDHRTYNRHGEAFDRGETFSGVDYEVGLAAAAELAAALPEGVSLPAATLAWIASQPGVTSVIPGARNVRRRHRMRMPRPSLDGGFDVDGVRRRRARGLRPASARGDPPALVRCFTTTRAQNLFRKERFRVLCRKICCATSSGPSTRKPQCEQRLLRNALPSTQCRRLVEAVREEPITLITPYTAVNQRGASSHDDHRSEGDREHEQHDPTEGRRQGPRHVPLGSIHGVPPAR